MSFKMKPLLFGKRMGVGRDWSKANSLKACMFGLQMLMEFILWSISIITGLDPAGFSACSCTSIVIL